MTDAATPDAPRTDRPSIANQIAWARGQAAQQARLASRAKPDSAARRLAEDRRRIAEAALRSLQSLQRNRSRRVGKAPPSDREPNERTRK